MARQYAPAMSRADFLQLQRSKGIKSPNYQKYLTHLAANRPGWNINRPMVAQHRNPPQRGPSYTYDALARRLQILTPQQMEAQANRMAATQMKYQRSILADEYKAAQEEAMNRMRAFQVAGNQAAAMNASLIGQVGGQYQAGADQLNAMAAAGSGMMSGATAADVAAANNALGNVGAPALSVGGPVGAPGVAGEAQAGVEQYRGGTLPAQGMGTAGGYAQAGLAGQISSQNLRATQEAQAAYMQAIGDANRARATATKALVAGRPDVAMKYLAQLQDNQRQAIALASSLVGAGFEQGMTKKEYTQKVKQQGIENAQWQATFNEGVRQFNTTISQKAAAEGVEMNTIDASASRAWGYLVAKNGQPILDKNGKLIPVASYGTSGKSGGLTPYQQSRLMEKADLAAQRAAAGKTDSKGNVTGVLTWQQTLKKLSAMGLNSQQAQAIARNYYNPGEDGTPAFWPEQAKWAQKKYGHLFGRAKKVVDQLNAGDSQDGWDLADRIREAILAGMTTTEISQLVLEGKNRLR